MAMASLVFSRVSSFTSVIAILSHPAAAKARATAAPIPVNIVSLVWIYLSDPLARKEMHTSPPRPSDDSHAGKKNLVQHWQPLKSIRKLESCFYQFVYTTMDDKIYVETQ